MTRWKNRDYSKVDRPEINAAIFYPRQSTVYVSKHKFIKELVIPLRDGGIISGIWAEVKNSKGSILLFHGNGELAFEYVDIAKIFLQIGISLICVDYRGYGNSSGYPTVSLTIDDAHDIFKFVLKRIQEEKEILVVMGRSLGCVPALEIAAAYENQVDGLIIESGFARSLPLLETMGIDTDYMGIKEKDGFANEEKIKCYSKPLLIIHAEEDFLIPIYEGELLFTLADSQCKKFLKIPNADHNDIFFTGMKDYLEAIIKLMDNAKK